MMDDVSELIMGTAPAVGTVETKKPTRTFDVSKSYGTPSKLLDNLRTTESGGDPLAINKVTKALGTYQFLPETAAMLHKQGVKFNPFDENESRAAADYYISQLAAKHGGDYQKAMADYGGFVKKDPSQYVGKVLKGVEPGKTEEVKTEPIKAETLSALPADDVSALIMGAQPVTKEPGKFAIEKFTEPLKSISYEDWQKHSVLAPYLNYRQHKTPETAQALIDAVTPIAKGIQTAVAHPIDTATAIAKALYQNPLGAAAEALKSTLYDPEQLLLMGAGGKAAEAGVEAAVPKVPKVEVPQGRIVPAAEAVPKENVPAYLRKQFAEKKAIEPIQPVEPTAAEQMQAQFGQKTAGAAEVATPTQRVQKAQELPIPIDLSKDQITRNPADVRFARETAKDPVLGQQLQEHYAGQNAKIQQNLDHLIEETGAELTGVNPAELSKKLIDTVQPIKNARKREYNNAYKAARDAGEMEEPIDIESLKNYAANHEAEAINAPIIKSLELKINNLAKEGNEISLNDLEEVRKMVGRLSGDTPTNAKYGREINNLIDSLTADVGGEKYKVARDLFKKYHTEFEDTPILKQITALKKGTTQRAVAMEDLIDKSIVGAPLEEVKKLYGSLQNMGEPGQAMIRELNGYMAQRVKNQATKNVQLDIHGRPYVSTPALNTIVNDLDRSGKLDFMFGKKNAEHYRTLNEVTKNIQTVPQGTTNPSGSASSILAALGEMGAQTAISGVPVPVVMIGKHLYGKHQLKQNLNKISEFINYGKQK